MKRGLLAIGSAVLILAVTLISPAAASTPVPLVWTARIGSTAVATIRVGSIDRFAVTARHLRAGTAYTITLRKGTCAISGKLLLSMRVMTTSLGTSSRSVALSAAQTRAAKLPLAVRLGTRCASFAAPIPVPTVSTISGTITGPSGAPLAGIQVGECDFVYHTCATATNTASNGTYSLVVRAGTYQIGFRDSSGTYLNGFYGASGFTPNPFDAAPVKVPPNANGIDAVLPLASAPSSAPGSLQGTVRDSSGGPVAGVFVEACSTNPPCSQVFTKTDTGGVFSLDLPPGGYWIEVDSAPVPQAWPDGLVSATGLLVPYGTDQAIFQVPSDRPLQLQITYPKVAHIAGSVYSRSRAALDGASVNACPSSGICDNATLSSDGNYATPVLPGVYNLTVCGWAGGTDCADGPQSLAVTGDVTGVAISIP